MAEMEFRARFFSISRQASGLTSLRLTSFASAFLATRMPRMPLAARASRYWDIPRLLVMATLISLLRAILGL